MHVALWDILRMVFAKIDEAALSISFGLLEAPELCKLTDGI